MSRLEADMVALRQVADEALRLEGDLTASMQRRLGLVYDRARRLWPQPPKAKRATGRSSSAITLVGPRINLGTGEVEAGIDLPVEYAMYVHRGKPGKELILDAGEDAAERIVDDLGERFR